MGTTVYYELKMIMLPAIITKSVLPIEEWHLLPP